MSAGASPEDLGVSPEVPGRRRRLEALAGVTVHGGDGRTVGRVRDVYLVDATGELAAITVVPRQLSARSVLIPAAAIESLPADPGERTADEDADETADEDAPEGDHHVHLRVTAAAARAGARPPQTLHATPEELAEAAAALGLGQGSLPA